MQYAGMWVYVTLSGGVHDDMRHQSGDKEVKKYFKMFQQF